MTTQITGLRVLRETITHLTKRNKINQIKNTILLNGRPKLTALFSYHCQWPQVKQRLQKMGALTSMNIFLRQEIDRMQRVITAVRTTLVDLKLAIDGTIIMSENLKDALDNIYDARVPAFWKKVT